MKILRFKSLESTQLYLKNALQTQELHPPIAVFTQNQTKGVGSQDRLWQGENGGFFLSFGLNKSALPDDLPLHSASIYFSFLFKQILQKLGSKTFVKWPNDLYLEDEKIGGVITNLVGEFIVCGLGLNLKTQKTNYKKIDIDLSVESVLKEYLDLVCACVSWTEIFSEYRVEFERSFKLNTHHKQGKICLKDCVLNTDGSLTIGTERVLSLR